MPQKGDYFDHKGDYFDLDLQNLGQEFAFLKEKTSVSPFSAHHHGHTRQRI